LLLRSGDRLLIAAAMRDARPDVTQHSLGFDIARLLVVPAPVDPCRGHAIPRVEGISIVLPHLLFSRETVTELVEYEIGVDGRDPADQDHKHPFHSQHSLLLSLPIRETVAVRGSSGDGQQQEEALRDWCALHSIEIDH
jgi:hypothetical protein